MNAVIWLLIIYFFIMNLIAITTTIRDKLAAVNHRRRVPERTLMLLGTLSSCLGMWITMKAIHHKTRKAKFMIGLPLIFVGEAILTVVILKLLGFF